MPHDAFSLRTDWVYTYLQTKKSASDLPRSCRQERPLFPQDSGEIRVRRRQPINVEIVREGKHWKTLGLIVSRTDNPRHLIVEDIWKPSLISEWNEKQAEKNQIEVGDIIVEANGESRDNLAILRAIQSIGEGGVLRLRIE